MACEDHQQLAKGHCASCAVLTISDTRSEADDTSGGTIRQLLESAGHTVAAHRIVKDEASQIDAALRAWIQDGRIQVICCTGGTGIARRDTTIEVVQRLLDKRLDGFGELFRMLSWDQIGAAAMLSRTVAGLAGDTFLFAMPGSRPAVRLAIQKLIVPQLPHLVWERQK